MKSFNKKMLPLVFLAAFFVIGLPFISIIMGSVDDSANMSGSDYEEQYNSTTETSIQSIALLEPVPLLFGVAILFVSFAIFKKSR